jgi:hypothetical protein
MSSVVMLLEYYKEYFKESSGESLASPWYYGLVHYESELPTTAPICNRIMNRKQRTSLPIIRTAVSKIN